MRLLGYCVITLYETVPFRKVLLLILTKIMDLSVECDLLFILCKLYAVRRNPVDGDDTALGRWTSQSASLQVSSLFPPRHLSMLNLPRRRLGKQGKEENASLEPQEGSQERDFALLDAPYQYAPMSTHPKGFAGYKHSREGDWHRFRS